MNNTFKKIDLQCALNCINVADLSYTDWVSIGMALKHEGFPCSVWEEWSRNDPRFKNGECEKKWNSFSSDGNPVTGGTIVMIANRYGFAPTDKEDMPLDWNDTIYDGAYRKPMLNSVTNINETDELIKYLELLFDKDDHVYYVTSSRFENGKHHPCGGVYNKTAGELIDGLKNSDSISGVLGKINPDAGAWIALNPFDGNGCKSDNVTKFKYALVESDTLSISAQETLYRKHRLPIVCLVHSGCKSLHAVVKVDANNIEEYKSRVNFLFNYLSDYGVDIDKQNKNVNRLSRMPGVYRMGKKQRLVDTNIGLSSWDEWYNYVTKTSNETLPESRPDDKPTLKLPPVVYLDDYIDNPPELSEELISGVLRRGHKMIVSSSSKAGKSFLLMELCLAFANGTKWLKWNCKKSKALYINFEIEDASCIHRFLEMRAKMNIVDVNRNLPVWNLRGYAKPLTDLVEYIIEAAIIHDVDVIILDPLYKIVTGDENNATCMSEFFNCVDRICTATGAAVIICHHHSKGAQGNKKAIDRASGSGVFARDPDAIIDLVELNLTDEIRATRTAKNVTGWRIETAFREFASEPPFYSWFEFPVHIVDDTGVLANTYAVGDTKSNLENSSKRRGIPVEDIENAYSALSINPTVSVKNIAEFVGCDEKTVRNKFKTLPNYAIINGVVYKK